MKIKLSTQLYYSAAAVVILALAPLSGVQAQSLAKCQSEGCLRKVVPYDTKTPPALDQCKVLDGKKSKEDFDEDLGVLCRLVISRAQAGQRSVETCRFDDSPLPDWEMGLKQPFLLSQYNQLLLTPLLKKYTIAGLPTRLGGYNNSTIHGSYVYDRQTTESGGQKRSISFATYFCVTEKPFVHYTPYFSVLKVNGKPVDQQNIAQAPTLEPVVLQVPSLEDVKAYEFADLNRDGANDLVFVEKEFGAGYLLNVCLYQKNKAECQLITSKASINSEDFISEPRLVVKVPNQIELQILNSNGQKSGEAVYRFDKNALTLVKKQGLK